MEIEALLVEHYAVRFSKMCAESFEAEFGVKFDFALTASSCGLRLKRSMPLMPDVR